MFGFLEINVNMAAEILSTGKEKAHCDRAKIA